MERRKFRATDLRHEAYHFLDKVEQNGSYLNRVKDQFPYASPYLDRTFSEDLTGRFLTYQDVYQRVAVEHRNFWCLVSGTTGTLVTYALKLLMLYKVDTDLVQQLSLTSVDVTAARKAYEQKFKSRYLPVNDLVLVHFNHLPDDLGSRLLAFTTLAPLTASFTSLLSSATMRPEVLELLQCKESLGHADSVYLNSTARK